VHRIAVTLLVLVCSACRPASEPSAPVPDAEAPAFVGRPWLATFATAAPGSLRILLADGTLLMDSCGETYRLATWRELGDGRIEWTEDSTRVEAEVTMLTDTRLEWRLHLIGGDTREETYRLATVPMVCPDMPR
jgi:hypothetical protein